MSHTHIHHRAHHSSKNLKAAFFMNLLFAFVELIGGWYTNSMAILSDALHDLGDSLGIGLSWYFERLSKKNGDKDYSYGYKRFSVLGAIINSTILITGSILIVIESIPRLFDPVMPNAQGMIFLAIGGVTVNSIAAYKISKGNSLNEKVAYLHLLEDVLGWSATLIVAIILHFRSIPILDPALSILISIYVLYNVFKNIRASLSIILQRTPANVDAQLIEQTILSSPGVNGVHDCHIWTLDGDFHVLSIHVVLSNQITIKDLIPLKASIKAKLKNLHIDHATLEFESPEEDCQSC